MKDSYDFKTQDMFSPQPVGRPKKYQNDAHRQRAYRKRRRKTLIDLIREEKLK